PHTAMVAAGRSVQWGRTELLGEALQPGVCGVPVRHEFSDALGRDLEETRANLGTDVAGVDQLSKHLGHREALRERRLERLVAQRVNVQTRHVRNGEWSEER